MIMLHIIKQIKGSFMNIIESGFLSQWEANRVADIADSNFDWNINLQELNSLLQDNSRLSKKVKLEAKKAYMQLQQEWQTNSVDKQRFINLMTAQKAEHQNILTVHESAKRNLRNNTVEKRHRDPLAVLSTRPKKTVTRTRTVRTAEVKDSRHRDPLKVLDTRPSNNTEETHSKSTLKRTANTEKVKYHYNVAEINSTNNIPDKYIKQLKLLDRVLTKYEKLNWDNWAISKHIGIIWIIREMGANEQSALLSSIVDTRNPECKKLMAWVRAHPAMLSTVLQMLMSFAMSGWTSISIPLFWVKIGSHMINKGPIRNMLKRAGVTNPVRLASVMRAEWVSKQQIEAISDLLAGKHFHWGALKKWVDDYYFGKTPALFKAIFKLFWKWSKEYALIEKFENPNTSVKERVIISRQLSDLANGSVIKDIERKIELARKLKKVEKDPSFVMNEHLRKKYEELGPGNADSIIRSLEKEKRDIKTELQQTIFKVNNAQTDLYNKTRSQSEKISEIKNWAIKIDQKLGIRPKWRLTWIWRWRYAPELGKWGWDKWLARVEQYSSSHNRNATALSTILSAWKVYWELWNMNSSLWEIENAFRNWRFLIPKERAELLERSKNTSTSGSWNTKFKQYAIYEVEIGWHKLYLKQNCSNVLDTTPDVDAYVEAGDYLTVSATVSVKDRTKTVTKKVKHKVKDKPSTDPTWNGTKNNAIDNKPVPASWTTDDIGWTTSTTPPSAPTTPPSTPTTPGGSVPGTPDVYEYVTKTYTYKIWKKYGIDLWKSLSTSLKSGLSSTEALEQCKNEIWEEKYNKVVKPHLKQITKEYNYSKAKWVVKATSKPIPVPYESSNNIDYVPPAISENVNKTYVIRSWDTLSKIAKKYGTTVSHLKHINNIKNVNKIIKGQEIKVA